MMWKLGINTKSCCQGQCSPKCNHKVEIITFKDKSLLYKPIKTNQCRKYVWICFDQAKDAELFYNIVAEFDKENGSMYEKMHGWCGDEKPFDIWHLRAFPTNNGENLVCKKVLASQASGLKKGSIIEILEVRDCGKNNFNMMIQLYFPFKHLKYVENKLKEALKND